MITTPVLVLFAVLAFMALTPILYYFFAPYRWLLADLVKAYRHSGLKSLAEKGIKILDLVGTIDWSSTSRSGKNMDSVKLGIILPDGNQLITHNLLGKEYEFSMRTTCILTGQEELMHQNNRFLIAKVRKNEYALVEAMV